MVDDVNYEGGKKYDRAVYLTEKSTEDQQTLRYVLTHELTHYRQLDHIWSALRAVALVLHWYNPLVWIAFRASRQDCEMACDEKTRYQLGEEHRGDYGSRNHSPSILDAATADSMTTTVLS